MLDRKEGSFKSKGDLMSGEEIERKFEVTIPEGASAAEEERLIQAATDREVDKLLDDLDPFK